MLYDFTTERVLQNLVNFKMRVYAKMSSQKNRFVQLPSIVP